MYSKIIFMHGQCKVDAVLADIKRADEIADDIAKQLEGKQITVDTSALAAFLSKDVFWGLVIYNQLLTRSRYLQSN